MYPTPLLHPLSSSARETELRIRNIMSGPKKRPPILFLILVFSLCLFCGNLVSCQIKESEPPTSDASVDLSPNAGHLPPSIPRERTAMC